MGVLLDRALGTLAAKRGRCPRCMKASLSTAALAWVLLMLLLLEAGRSIATEIGGLAAIGMTALWLAHLAAFASRAVLARARKMPGGSGNADGLRSSWQRRRFVSVFARTFLFAAVASALPYRIARSLQLAQDCNCYTETDCGCPAEFPQCVFNPGTGDAVCCGPNTVGCAGPSTTYCCPPGTNCYGDDQCSGG